jgi:hypothetical protein
MKIQKQHLSRRRILQGMGLGAAAFFMRDLAPAFAEPLEGDGDPTFFILCTFDGGWDQMLALDPRDHTIFDGTSGVTHPAYDILAQNDDELATFLANNPTGIIQPDGGGSEKLDAGHPLTFGPAVGRLAEGDLYKKLCVVRGVNMGTLTHEVGRRYFLTGKFPGGLQASGSSIPTWVVNEQGDSFGFAIPNLVVGMESYNVGLDHFATGLTVNTSKDLLTVLQPLNTPNSKLNGPSTMALDTFLGKPGATSCSQLTFDAQGQISQYYASRGAALEMMFGGDSGTGYAPFFQFPNNPGNNPELQALYNAFNISGTPGQVNQQLNGAPGEALIAAQAITKGVSHAVSIKLAQGIDHHDDDYLDNHSPALRAGFNALADLIHFLENTEYQNSGSSFWNRTVLMCTSDFARTPNLNARNGRDHHLASSCLVAGKGIRGGRVLGGTGNNLEFKGMDLTTGHVQETGGYVVRPPDVHATVLEAIGLSYENLSNQNPEIIKAMLA